MRRILAVLSLLTMGNMVIAQASWSCERNGAVAPASASAADSHAHHGSPAPATAPEPAGEGTDHCLSMAHCVIAPAIAAATAGSAQKVAEERVSMASEHGPRFHRAAPELPPPRP